MAALLPSMQYGRLYSTQPDGKRVYLTSAGKLVCCHGECSSTICFWLRAEKRAAAEGQPPPARGGSRGLSQCDCQNTDGLNVGWGVGAAAPCPPAPPPSLFELLEGQGTERVVVRGREARRIPHLPGPTFVTSTGRLCCRHGASRQSLIAKQKATPSARRPACSCELKPLPVRRTGLRGIPLGKFSGPLSEAHAVNQRALCAGGE